MNITVTVKSEGVTRPSGHKLSSAFVRGINYSETFSCKDSRRHADLLMKVLDLLGLQCGIEKGEFDKDDHFIGEMAQIIQHIETLHKYAKPK